MEKDFLQSLKIEISKNLKLNPYERMSLYKILGLSKSENGMKILLRDIKQHPEVREKAFCVLKDYNNPEVTASFAGFLNSMELSVEEKICILEYIEKFGTVKEIAPVIKFIEDSSAEAELSDAVSRAFNVLRTKGAGSNELFSWLKNLAQNKENTTKLRCLSIEAISAFRDIAFFEDFFKERNEEITYSTYKSLAMLSDNLTAEMEESKTESDIPYTYVPELEDKLVLNIRVLLGKMTPNFDSYSKNVKVAFINAMICCNHREFIIYCMKALNSNDTELVDLTLNLLLTSVYKLRDPDKIFRNLLALSTDSDRDNRTIISIFERYFNGLKENRKNMLFRDKLYNYIVVTLETYFETYRKEFMITEVVEKNFPESFQDLRKYLLENFSSDLIKRLVYFLKNGNRVNIQPVLIEIYNNIPFIESSKKDIIRFLIELLYDKDQKSRDNSASRIEDVKFEKRHLRNRIQRICEIIGRMKIEEAATSLVKILNYVKKYQDKDIFDAAAGSLSMLNYSYMLGELEVLLVSGDENDQRKAAELLSLFKDKRAMNIFVDFIKDKSDLEPEFFIRILNIFLAREFTGNTVANSVFKQILERSQHNEIRRLALLCVGKCGIESDVEYLNEFFSRTTVGEEKEGIVQAIGYIIQINSAINRRLVTKYLMEYLKDSSIKVRIYACSLLIQLGNKDAMKVIREMMIIKNKYVQREVLNIIGSQKSIEFSYFLISLLKEEYGISSDIINILSFLSDEELRDIDQFVVNMFKKYDSAELDLEDKANIKSPIANILLPRIERSEKTILIVEVVDYLKMISESSMVQIITVYRLIESQIISVIMQNKGIIFEITGGRIYSCFQGAADAMDTAFKIHNNINLLNKLLLPENRRKLQLSLITDKITTLNEEVLNLPRYKINAINVIPVENSIIIDEATKHLLEQICYCRSFPDIIMDYSGLQFKCYELITPINSLSILQGALNELIKEEQEGVLFQKRLDEESNKRKREEKTMNAVEYAKAFDDLGSMLKMELNELSKYVQRRSTDRELLVNVEKMIANINKRYLFESTKIIMQ